MLFLWNNSGLTVNLPPGHGDAARKRLLKAITASRQVFVSPIIYRD